MSATMNRLPFWARVAVDIAGMILICSAAVYAGQLLPGYKAAAGAMAGYVWGATMWWRYAWINAALKED